MKIGALLPWFGCKRQLAPRIVAELGPHRVYWEPFCGSCSVLFEKARATYESVNDLHGDLINLARVVQEPSTAEALYGRVQRTLFHEDLLPLAKERLTAGELAAGAADPERAYWYLVFSWMGLNGVSGTPLHRTGTFAVRYSGKGGNGATRWRSVAESIPDWHERLAGVQILRRDAFEVLENLDDAAGTVLYVDPPYLIKGARYVHDFAGDDHGRLAEVLARFRSARVLLSYYADPLIARLYPGWTQVPCPVAKSLVNSGMRDERGATLAPEVLVINGPRLSAETSASLFPEDR